MTKEAKRAIAEILLTAHERLIKSQEPFWILSQIIDGYFREWNWI